MKTTEIKPNWAPPTFRYVFMDGMVLYPRFVPDGKGDWKMHDEALALIRKDQSERRRLTKNTGNPQSSSG